MGTSCGLGEADISRCVRIRVYVCTSYTLCTHVYVYAYARVYILIRVYLRMCIRIYAYTCSL